MGHYAKPFADDANTSRTPEEDTHNSSWQKILIIIIIII